MLLLVQFPLPGRCLLSECHVGFSLNKVTFNNVKVTIAKLSNYTNAVHDWRPSPPVFSSLLEEERESSVFQPEVVPAPVDVFWSQGVQGISFILSLSHTLSLSLSLSLTLKILL